MALTKHKGYNIRMIILRRIFKIKIERKFVSYQTIKPKLWRHENNVQIIIEWGNFKDKDIASEKYKSLLLFQNNLC